MSQFDELLKDEKEIDSELSSENVEKELKKKATSKKEKIYFTADFPKLCDLVKNSNEVKFLMEDGQIQDKYIFENKVYNPPYLEDLDYLVPEFRKVVAEAKKHDTTDDTDNKGGCPYCLEVYKELINYHKEISELPDNLYYDLLSFWDFHTYLIEKFNFSPIPYFFATKERGKTRTAKGMIYVSRRGIMTETLREANLIRWGRDHKATLLFDVKNFAKKLETSQAEDLVYGRAERGVIASRVLFPEKGAFRDTVRFSVFGPTVVTSNRMIDDVGLSRTIVIEMKPSLKIFLKEPTPESALELKEKLTGMRFVHFKQKFDESPKEETGRLEDMFIGYLRMIRTLFPSLENKYRELKKLIKTQNIENNLDSFDVQILQIIISSEKLVEPGSSVLTYDTITSIYNEGKRENLHLDGRSIGRTTKAIGFTSKRNSDGTKRGIFYDTELIKKLKSIYGFDDSGGHALLASATSEASDLERMFDE